MKRLNKELSLTEKIILLLMVIFLLALVYYYFVDRPVRNGREEYESEISNLEMTNGILSAKLASLQETSESFAELKEEGTLSYMASYNNGNAEMELLHKILSYAASYNISFSNVTRDGDLIRRKLAVTFTASDYTRAADIIDNLLDSDYRSLASDIKVTGITANTDTAKTGTVSVSMNLTFYETMEGGTADEGLPAAETQSSSTEEE